MRKYFFRIAIILSFFLPYGSTLADLPIISVIPEHISQGEPLMVRIENIASISLVKKITFDGKKIDIFLYQSVPTALIGIDLRKKTGNYDLIVMLTDGTILKQIINVEARERKEKPLGIPEKLGGNTKKSQNNLVTALAKEQKFFSNLFTSKKAQWSDKFIFPVANPIVTSPYGYSRKTGEYLIAHKGTDLRAPEGTEIVAMNSGIVRVVRNSTTHGKTVVIDHGLGLMTFYLHLSKFNVKVGQSVSQGQVIGLSGQTGYALAPHLHLGVRINNIAIDPIKFISLFQ